MEAQKPSALSKNCLKPPNLPKQGTNPNPATTQAIQITSLAQASLAKEPKRWCTLRHIWSKTLWLKQFEGAFVDGKKNMEH